MKFGSVLVVTLIGSLVLLGTTSSHAELVGLWRFDEDVDPQPDSSGNGHVGSRQGDAAWANDPERGGVMEFDGNQDYVEVEDTDKLSIEGPITIAAWANFNQFDTFNSILGKNGEANLNHPAPYDLYTNQNGDGRVQFYSGGGDNTGPSSTVAAELPPEVEEWQHIAVTLNEDFEVVHYLNGEINGEGLITTEPFDEDLPLFIGSRADFVTNMDGFLDDVAIFDEALSEDQVNTIMSGDFSAFGVTDGDPALQAGDADQDLDFDQLDLVKVSIAGKYLTGMEATWGDGDWNAAPGGEPGSPPEGDKLFNQLDVIAALNNGLYLTGPYGALKPGGMEGDEQTSLKYDPGTGELSVVAPASTELTSVNITSAGSKFIGDKPPVLDGAFDNFAADNIFKATFGGSFGTTSFGNVLPASLSQEEVLADLSAVGSLAGGGDLGDVDLIYVPEPSSVMLILCGLLAIASLPRRSR